MLGWLHGSCWAGWVVLGWLGRVGLAGSCWPSRAVLSRPRVWSHFVFLGGPGGIRLFRARFVGGGGLRGINPPLVSSTHKFLLTPTGLVKNTLLTPWFYHNSSILRLLYVFLNRFFNIWATPRIHFCWMHSWAGLAIYYLVAWIQEMWPVDNRPMFSRAYWNVDFYITDVFGA